MPADDRRALIMLTAGRLFGEHGYAGTRLDDIAAAAGVTKPIVYRHFNSKQALYLALLDKHEADLPSFLEHADELPAGAPTDAVLAAILEHWFDYVRANQHSWLMLFRDSSGDPEIRERRGQVSVRARQVIAAFIAEQPATQVPAEQIAPTAELLTSGLAGLALWWIDHPAVEKRIVVEVATRMAMPAFS